MTDDRSTSGDGRDTPVVLSRIYTRTGDDGTTALADGAALALVNFPADIERLLLRIQNELFDCGADLATPLPAEPPEYPQLRIDESYVTALEAACDEYNAALPTLRSFVLPGGSAG